MESDRLANLIGALALGLSDGVLRSAQRDAPGSCPAAAIALVGHLPGLSIRQLSLGLRLSHPAAVRLVDRLTAHGLVVRERSGDDGRAVALTLTDRGRLSYEALLGSRRDFLAGVLGALSMDERALLTDLAAKILSRMIETGEHPLSVCRLCDVDACADCPVEARFANVHGAAATAEAEVAGGAASVDRAARSP